MSSHHLARLLGSLAIALGRAFSQRERGNIDTPLEPAILDPTKRFTLVIDVIDRVPGLAGLGRH